MLFLTPALEGVKWSNFTPRHLYTWGKNRRYRLDSGPPSRSVTFGEERKFAARVGNGTAIPGSPSPWSSQYVDSTISAPLNPMSSHTKLSVLSFVV